MVGLNSPNDDGNVQGGLEVINNQHPIKSAKNAYVQKFGSSDPNLRNFNFKDGDT
jgi:hypothetical protein